MTDPSARSSGNLLADRRFGYAIALAAEGDHGAAADLLRQVVAIVPDWAPAWLSLGLSLEEADQAAAALAAYERADLLDPDGTLGAGLHAGRLGGVRPDTLRPGFVAALFDQYAERFDRHLTDALGYRGPVILVEALERVEPQRHYAAALDLGCGTGLMARALGSRATAIDGVDLAPRMVAKAEATGLYRHLAVAEVAAFFATARPAGYDLVLAADFFAYVGRLESVLRGVAAVLQPGGTLGFTVQRSDGDGVSFGRDMRFSHRADYLAAAINAAGLKTELIEDRSSRRDRDIDVPGLVVVACKA